jgi:DNA-binding response OmpR family regulator
MSAKIFIIEDEPDMVRALIMLLQASGYRTACAPDGASAARRVREEKPDLVLLDICLPGCNGFEVLQQLRQDPATDHIPIIFLTARSTVADRQQARHLGAAGYMVKPFQWPSLIKLIQEVLAAPDPAKG